VKLERHGLRHTPLYEIWKSMKQRCHNPKNKDFKHYGGRGITVCDRWRNSFMAFREDINRRPDSVPRWSRVTREDISRILELRREGLSYVRIASIIKTVSPSQVCNICLRGIAK
jgi:hypothetical protein